jgi:hypothetical protein
LDSGKRAVEWLYAQLRIDDYWAVRGAGGFRWWADKHAQDIEVVGQEQGGPEGAVGHLVTVRTEVLRGVQLDDDKLAALNSEVMSFASMSGLVLDEENGTLSLSSLARVWEENESWVDPFLSMAAVLQLAEAAMFGSQLAARLDAEAAMSGHPEHGVRAQPDEMTEAVAKLVVPTGRRESVWQTAELTMAASQLAGEPDILEVSLEPGGFVMDVPFGELPSRCQVLCDVPHPWYGNGLLVLQQLPIAPPSESVGAALALTLNGIELTREQLGYGFGSYAWRGERMYFISFVPNAAYQPALVPNLAASCAQRARSLAVLMAAEAGGADQSE